VYMSLVTDCDRLSCVSIGIPCVMGCWRHEGRGLRHVHGVRELRTAGAGVLLAEGVLRRRLSRFGGWRRRAGWAGAALDANRELARLTAECARRTTNRPAGGRTREGLGAGEACALTWRRFLQRCVFGRRRAVVTGAAGRFAGDAARRAGRGDRRGEATRTGARAGRRITAPPRVGVWDFSPGGYAAQECGGSVMPGGPCVREAVTGQVDRRVGAHARAIGGPGLPGAGRDGARPPKAVAEGLFTNTRSSRWLPVEAVQAGRSQNSLVKALPQGADISARRWPEVRAGQGRVLAHGRGRGHGAVAGVSPAPARGDGDRPWGLRGGRDRPGEVGLWVFSAGHLCFVMDPTMVRGGAGPARRIDEDTDSSTRTRTAGRGACDLRDFLLVYSLAGRGPTGLVEPYCWGAHIAGIRPGWDADPTAEY